MQPQDVETLAKTTENKFRKMMRELKTTNPPEGPCSSPITKKALKRAITQLKTGKATGLENIPSEALKHFPEVVMNAFLRLYNLMWDATTTPEA